MANFMTEKFVRV